MNHKTMKLKNGLSVHLIHMPRFQSATILAMFRTGSKYETRGNSGLSHFLEHMFFKGTDKRPTTLDISSELDSIGADFNAFTSKEYTGYYIKSQKAKLNVAIDVLSDMLLNSKFEQEEIDREKGVIIEEMNMYEDNPMMHIEDVFESLLYGDTPAGWDTIGFKESVLNLQRKDFVKYFNTQYGTKSMALFVAGNFNEKKLIADLESKFAAIKNNDYQAKKKVVEKQSKPAFKIKEKKTDQYTLSLGFRAFPAKHKDELNLKLLSVILGGSMSSRLFIELRERRGLAYYVRSSNELYSDCGYINVQAGVPKGKLEESISVILEQCRLMSKDLVSDVELKRAKDLLSGKLIVGMEGTDDYSSWYGKQYSVGDSFLSPEEFLEKVNKISSEDIRRVAKKIFVNESLNLALIGPKNKIDFNKILKI